jgi:hypothetical protein
MKFFCTLLCMKNNSIFGHLLNFFFVIKFQSHGRQHDHGLLCIVVTYSQFDSNIRILYVFLGFLKKYLKILDTKANFQAFVFL